MQLIGAYRRLALVLSTMVLAGIVAPARGVTSEARITGDSTARRASPGETRVLSPNGAAGDESIVFIDGQTTTPEVRSIFASTDGDYRLRGTVDNTGAILPLNDDTGRLLMSGTFGGDPGVIEGGTIETRGNGILHGGGALEGVTLDGQAKLDDTTIRNGLTLKDATVDMLGEVPDKRSAGRVTFESRQLLRGDGLIRLHGREQFDSSLQIGWLSVKDGVTMRVVDELVNLEPNISSRLSRLTNHGRIEVAGEPAGRLAIEAPWENRGTIVAKGSDTPWSVSRLIVAESGTNHGTISAVNGGRISLSRDFRNEGTLKVSGGGRIQVGDGWTNTGTVKLGRGFLEFAATLGSGELGRIESTGGAVNVTGTLDNRDTTLDLNDIGDLHVTSQGRIRGGTIRSGDGGQLHIGGSVLEDVRLEGDAVVGVDEVNQRVDRISASLGGDTTVAGTLRFIGPDTATRSRVGISGVGVSGEGGEGTLSGPGEIVFDGPGSGVLEATASGLVTIGQDLTIRTGSGSGEVIGASKNGFVSRGTIWAKTPGERLTLSGVWSNEGTLRASAGELVLDGQFSTADLAGVEPAGGVMALEGELDNTNEVFRLDDNTGSWYVDAEITGGRLETRGDARFIVQSRVFGDLGAKFTGTTVDGTVQVGEEGLLLLEGQTRLDNGRVVLSGKRASLTTRDSDVEGDGLVAFEGEQGWRVAGETTLGRNVAVRFSEKPDTANLVEFNDGATLINRGAIDAGRRTTLSAQTGGDPSLINHGTIAVGPTNTLRLMLDWENNGTIRVDRGHLRLGGNYGLSDLSTIDRDKGLITLAGRFDNRGNTLRVDSADRRYEIAAMVEGGTIESTDGTPIRLGNATFRNVDYEGNLRVTESAGFEIASCTTQPGRSIEVRGGGRLILPTAQALRGEIVFRRTGLRGGVIEFDRDVTIFPDAVVSASDGRGRVSAYGQLVENEGTIAAAGEASSVVIESLAFRNRGVLQAEDGGRIDIRAMRGDVGELDFDDGGHLSFDGTYALDGNVRVAAGSSLTLKGDWSVDDLDVRGRLGLGGELSRTSLKPISFDGATLDLVSGRYDNTASTIRTSQAEKAWRLAGGKLVGGAVASVDETPLRVTRQGGGLKDVTLTTDLTIASEAGSGRGGGGRRPRLLGGGESEPAPSDDPLLVQGEFNLQESAVRLTGQAGTIALGPDARIRGRGEVVFDAAGDGVGWLTKEADFDPAAQLEIPSGITLRTEGSGGVVGPGASPRDPRNPISVRNQGRIVAEHPEQTIRVAGDLSNEAELIAREGGRIEVRGMFDQTENGRITMGLAERATPRLVAREKAALDGTFEVDLVDGFMPEVDDTFNLIDGDLSNGFDQLDLPGLDGALGWRTDALAERGELSVIEVLLGDMNNDGTINNLDINPFVTALTNRHAFRRDVGVEAASLGDINGDGRLNNLDINAFIGLLVGGGSLRSVLEPASAALLALAGGLLSYRRPRRDA